MSSVQGDYKITVTKEQGDHPYRPDWSTYVVTVCVTSDKAPGYYECQRRVSLPPGQNFEEFMKSAEIQQAIRGIFAEIAYTL